MTREKGPALRAIAAALAGEVVGRQLSRPAQRRMRCLIEGVLATLSLPASFVTPPARKRLGGSAASRDRAIDVASSEAIHRWPDKACLLSRIKDGDRAEAALIGVAGAVRRGRF